MDQFWGTVIGIIGAITTVGSLVVLYIKGRGENKVAEINAKVALDKRIDERVTLQLSEAWTEIKDLRTTVENLESKANRQTGAITRILRAIARQWPGPEGPDLDPIDIAEIEETIPAQWIRPKPK